MSTVDRKIFKILMSEIKVGNTLILRCGLSGEVSKIEPMSEGDYCLQFKSNKPPEWLSFDKKGRSHGDPRWDIVEVISK